MDLKYEINVVKLLFENFQSVFGLKVWYVLGRRHPFTAWFHDATFLKNSKERFTKRQNFAKKYLKVVSGKHMLALCGLIWTMAFGLIKMSMKLR